MGWGGAEGYGCRIGERVGRGLPSHPLAARGALGHVMRQMLPGHMLPNHMLPEVR